MRSISPMHVKHLVERRLLGDASFRDICDDHIIVNEAEPYDYPPSLFLPHHLENVVKLHPETSKQAEDGRVQGEKGFHDPIEAFRITNVKLRDAGLYKRNWRYYFPHTPVPPEKIVRAEGGAYALASSYSGIQYFGHWLRDDLTTALMAKDFADLLCVRTPDWPHAAPYLDIFEQPWPVIDHGHFDELFFFMDFAQNSHKIERFRQLRAKIRTRVKQKYSGHTVYLRRGNTGAIKRVISNETEVLKALADNGVIILDLTADPIEKIVETLLEARLFITVEGSQAAHSLYTIADGGGYLSIVPPCVFNNPAKDWLTPLGVKYGFVVGERDGDAFKVNVPDLLKMADKLEASL